METEKYDPSLPLFLLDSGAFSVWNKGFTIDLDDYIRFCEQYPECSYFVNLDVIPGKPNDPKSLTPDSIEHACQESWDNYQKMLRTLPMEKVVPVFHMNDSFEWLERYLDFGTPYIGISPANDRTTKQKKGWLKKVKKYIFDSDGQPIIRTHGFAVTSYELMKFMQWHSVDSASWVRHSAYGVIYVPMKRGGEWAYDVAPFQLNASPKSPTREERQKHYTTLSPYLKQIMDDYLNEMRMQLGEFEIVKVPEGYKRSKEDPKELWYEKGKTGKILRVLSKGIVTCHQRRFWMNMKFLHRANDVLPVDHIYFAGAGGSLHERIEYKLGRRLMSYHEIKESPGSKKVFEKHLEILGR